MWSSYSKLVLLATVFLLFLLGCDAAGGKKRPAGHDKREKHFGDLSHYRIYSPEGKARVVRQVDEDVEALAYLEAAPLSPEQLYDPYTLSSQLDAIEVTGNVLDGTDFRFSSGLPDALRQRTSTVCSSVSRVGCGYGSTKGLYNPIEVGLGMVAGFEYTAQHQNAADVGAVGGDDGTNEVRSAVATLSINPEGDAPEQVIAAVEKAAQQVSDLVQSMLVEEGVIQDHEAGAVQVNVLMGDYDEIMEAAQEPGGLEALLAAQQERKAQASGQVSHALMDGDDALMEEEEEEELARLQAQLMEALQQEYPNVDADAQAAGGAPEFTVHTLKLDDMRDALGIEGGDYDDGMGGIDADQLTATLLRALQQAVPGAVKDHVQGAVAGEDPMAAQHGEEPPHTTTSTTTTTTTTTTDPSTQAGAASPDATAGPDDPSQAASQIDLLAEALAKDGLQLNAATEEALRLAFAAADPVQTAADSLLSEYHGVGAFPHWMNAYSSGDSLTGRRFHYDVDALPYVQAVESVFGEMTGPSVDVGTAAGEAKGHSVAAAAASDNVASGTETSHDRSSTSTSHRSPGKDKVDTHNEPDRSFYKVHWGYPHGQWGLWSHGGFEKNIVQDPYDKPSDEESERHKIALGFGLAQYRHPYGRADLTDQPSLPLVNGLHIDRTTGDHTPPYLPAADSQLLVALYRDRPVYLFRVTRKPSAAMRDASAAGADSQTRPFDPLDVSPSNPPLEPPTVIPLSHQVSIFQQGTAGKDADSTGGASGGVGTVKPMLRDVQDNSLPPLVDPSRFPIWDNLYHGDQMHSNRYRSGHRHEKYFPRPVTRLDRANPVGAWMLNKGPHRYNPLLRQSQRKNDFNRLLDYYFANMMETVQQEETEAAGKTASAKDKAGSSSTTGSHTQTQSTAADPSSSQTGPSATPVMSTLPARNPSQPPTTYKPRTGQQASSSPTGADAGAGSTHPTPGSSSHSRARTEPTVLGGREFPPIVVVGPPKVENTARPLDHNSKVRQARLDAIYQRIADHLIATHVAMEGAPVTQVFEVRQDRFARTASTTRVRGHLRHALDPQEVSKIEDPVPDYPSHFGEHDPMNYSGERRPAASSMPMDGLEHRLWRVPPHEPPFLLDATRPHERMATQPPHHPRSSRPDFRSNAIKTAPSAPEPTQTRRARGPIPLRDRKKSQPPVTPRKLKQGGAGASGAGGAGEAKVKKGIRASLEERREFQRKRASAPGIIHAADADIGFITQGSDSARRHQRESGRWWNQYLGQVTDYTAFASRRWQRINLAMKRDTGRGTTNNGRGSTKSSRKYNKRKG